MLGRMVRNINDRTHPSTDIEAASYGPGTRSFSFSNCRGLSKIRSRAVAA